MTEQEFDEILIKKGFVFGSFDEFEELLSCCPFVARTRYEHYGPRYCKYFVLSISLRSWYVFVPNYSLDEP